MTGRECEEMLYQMEDTLRAVKSLFNNAKDLQGVIAKYIDEHDSMKKEIESFQAQAVERLKEQLLSKIQDKNRRQRPCLQTPTGSARRIALRYWF